MRHSKEGKISKMSGKSAGKQDDRRKQVRLLIQRRFAELKKESPEMSDNEAAAQAVASLRGNAVATNHTSKSKKVTSPSPQQTSKAPPESIPSGTEVQFFTLASLKALVSECQANDNYLPLVRKVGQVFSNADSLNSSFLSEGSFADGGSLSHQDDLTVDRRAARQAFELLTSLNQSNVQSSLINAMLMLADGIEMEIRYRRPSIEAPNYLNQFVIWLENPDIQSPEYLDAAFPRLCHVMAAFPASHQKHLIRYWSSSERAYLSQLIGSFQQLITLKLLAHSSVAGAAASTFPNHEPAVCDAVVCLGYVYLASLLGGTHQEASPVSSSQSPVVLHDDANDDNNDDDDDDDDDEALPISFGMFGFGSVTRRRHGRRRRRHVEGTKGGWDQLERLFGVSFQLIRCPLVGAEEFVNEVLNDSVNVREDFIIMKQSQQARFGGATGGGGGGGGFSFLNYPFVLKPEVKVRGLSWENRLKMQDQGRLTVLQMISGGYRNSPFLKLKINRETLIQDALLQLEMMAQESPQELKKQLFIEFEGEQGFDEGGVQKEFFQLVIEELFNPKYAMFSFVEESRECWFNPTSFENDSEYMLVGIMLGLAIYNHVILDLRFPMTVYRKLMGYPATFEDLKAFHPVLSASLVQLLESDENVEETFMCTFSINYTDVLGTVLTYDLKENGSQIPVTNENREEYVRLYADFVLNKMIEKQFSAFKRGFDMVVDENPLRVWFQPNELELLICGSEDLNFMALEESTLYDGGFTKDSQVIKWFWEVVHEFSEKQKKKLLSFATGSDRVPLGGLSKVKFIIAKNGADSDRLPTAHTCFNVLLLCEYSSKEKLEERLLKAITHAKGFGMI